MLTTHWLGNFEKETAKTADGMDQGRGYLLYKTFLLHFSCMSDVTITNNTMNPNYHSFLLLLILNWSSLENFWSVFSSNWWIYQSISIYLKRLFNTLEVCIFFVETINLEQPWKKKQTNKHKQTKLNKNIRLNNRIIASWNTEIYWTCIDWYTNWLIDCRWWWFR